MSKIPYGIVTGFKLLIQKESIYFKSYADCSRYLRRKYSYYPFFTPRHDVIYIEMDEKIQKEYLRQNRNNAVDNLI